LKSAFRKGDLKLINSTKNGVLVSSDILVWPFNINDDPLDPSIIAKGVSIEMD
jgi:hypothetical protein